VLGNESLDFLEVLERHDVRSRRVAAEAPEIPISRLAVSHEIGRGIVALLETSSRPTAIDVWMRW
jgi:hypothetical protein